MQGHEYENFADARIQPMLLRGIAWAAKKPVNELVDYKPAARGGGGPRPMKLIVGAAKWIGVEPGIPLRKTSDPIAEAVTGVPRVVS